MRTYDPLSKERAVRFTEVAITPSQTKLWVETRTAFIWHCPAFAHILYKLMNPRGNEHIAVFTSEVPIAATDGVNLLLNPETFFKYSLSERIFIVGHEVLHNIFDHCGLMHAYKARGQIKFANGTTLPYDAEQMNIAEDLVINDILIDAGIGSFNKEWLHDPKLVTKADAAIEAYRKIFKKKPGGGGKRFDMHLPPGAAGTPKDKAGNPEPRNDAQWKMEVAAAAASAKAQGKLPAGLERLLAEVLEPQVDWANKIRSLINRVVGRDAYDWRKLDRRLIVRGIGAPGKTGFGAGVVVVGVDTSGSIGGKTLDVFMAEVSGILEDVKPRELKIVWCDAKVHRADDCDDAADLTRIRCGKIPGGGGTAFEPVFNWVHDEGIVPDALVYLTDGFGTFPSQAPSYPVIWASITPDYKYPFGEVVDVPLQA